MKTDFGTFVPLSRTADVHLLLETQEEVELRAPAPAGDSDSEFEFEELDWDALLGEDSPSSTPCNISDSPIIANHESVRSSSPSPSPCLPFDVRTASPWSTSTTLCGADELLCGCGSDDPKHSLWCPGLLELTLSLDDDMAVLDSQLYQEAEELCAAVLRMKAIEGWRSYLPVDLVENLQALVDDARVSLAELDTGLRWQGLEVLEQAKPTHAEQANLNLFLRLDLEVAIPELRADARDACLGLDGLRGLHLVEIGRVSGGENKETREKVQKEVDVVRRRARAVHDVAKRMGVQRPDLPLLSVETIGQLRGMLSVRRAPNRGRAAQVTPVEQPTVLVDSPTASSATDSESSLQIAQKNVPVFGKPSLRGSSPRTLGIPEAFREGNPHGIFGFLAYALDRDSVARLDVEECLQRDGCKEQCIRSVISTPSTLAPLAVTAANTERRPISDCSPAAGGSQSTAGVLESADGDPVNRSLSSPPTAHPHEAGDDDIVAEPEAPPDAGFHLDGDISDDPCRVTTSPIREQKIRAFPECRRMTARKRARSLPASAHYEQTEDTLEFSEGPGRPMKRART
ncbi:hypothetical protein PUNSTDRAFT_136742 [Punctularia strigosozonata HHB-11173 SS5]|uniref:uncharacterized protein n=1 Tax=Punctularia strigosozonata (strain HHB-11173) TaxID=741275 RepID=UPI0004416F9C|nr:uncharacterized protein PUNSTDRAFT_136742 [Punctularia strigosozonata HHB-11173 SS5]EIN06925.1 hypothetical protein PUNSTDRAFT_136742 [Punctularia strigosozonata HHB-11173 SS5]